ncbi:MAG: hypothetical protein KF788_15235 [Piscinibacter sp.]|nr:hypothetical protein [Piscinibacter sp.]
MTLQAHSSRGAAGVRPLALDPGEEPSPDGWLGTHDEPGYRAGQVVVKLADLPVVDDRHLYLDLLLLDPDGRIADSHSGPCPAMDRARSAEDRARFVRVVAELLRHAPDDDRGLAGLNGALTHLREQGIDDGRLALVTQQLDGACSDAALVAALAHVLELSFGADEARVALRDVLANLARSAPRGEIDPREIDAPLTEQVRCVVRVLGRARARRYLREATDFDLLPTAELLGL